MSSGWVGFAHLKKIFAQNLFVFRYGIKKRFALTPLAAKSLPIFLVGLFVRQLKHSRQRILSQ